MEEELLKALENHPEGLTANEIEERTSYSHVNSVRHKLNQLIEDGVVIFEKVTKKTPKKLCSTGRKTKQKTTLFFLTKTAST